MLKLRHSSLVVISGMLWLGIGVFLLQLGLNLLMTAIAPRANMEAYPLLKAMSSLTGEIEQAIMVVITLGLLVGYFKGKYALGKSVQRVVARIKTLPNPVSPTRMYGRAYYILIGLMILLGISMRVFGLANDIRGAVDVTVGAALINGAFNYFRVAYVMRTQHAS